eukprot:6428564-Prymnesium_polylepis.1
MLKQGHRFGRPLLTLNGGNGKLSRSLPASEGRGGGALFLAHPLHRPERRRADSSAGHMSACACCCRKAGFSPPRTSRHLAPER